MVATIVDKESFEILDHLKWSNLAFSKYISNTFSCLFESLFFIHTTLRIFRMSKLAKATYTFSHKIKLIYLTANKYGK